MSESQHDIVADPTRLIAVVGATDTPGKYGGIIYRDLRRRGHRVVAVNPNRQTVAGDPCYPNLTSVPEQPAIVNLVIPPTAGREVVDEWIDLGGTAVWFQPGSYDRELVDRAKANGLDVIDGDCIMVVSRRLAS